MDNVAFATLCSRAWSLPVLAHLAGQPRLGARISPTAHALGAGRQSISATFAHLGELGLLERMPGHGHPLRPEARLSEAGAAVAAWAQPFWAFLEPDERATARRAWTLPVLRVARDMRSFGELRCELSPVTDRALALCLKRLVAQRLLRRDVDGAQRPPRVTYVGSGRGAALSDALQATQRLGSTS